jgi:mono/diheme cytochrome c family protein
MFHIDALFWQRMHGGSTHFPIVLLLASVVFDLIAWRSRDEGVRRGLQIAGLGSAVVAVLGGIGAIISGLFMTRGEVVGHGYEKLHHLFVWPAFGLCTVLVAWRVTQHKRKSHRGPLMYLGGMSVAFALMMGAAFWGGEMMLGAETGDAALPAPLSAQENGVLVASGQKLFRMNCAHCHGDDATGDEGPDLHGVTKSDARIAALIKNGVKDEMPKFSAKLNDADVRALIAFVRSLK